MSGILYDRKTVPSLEDICVRLICKNLKIYTYYEKITEDDERIRRWKLPYPGYRITARPAQKILSQLCKRKLLTDDTMLLFSHEFVDLVSPVIREAKITQSSLRILKDFSLNNLSATNLENLNLNGIVSCLGEQSVRHMFSLNVSGTSIMFENRMPILVILGRFKSLHSLNVSRTELSNQGLQMIVKDLPKLRHLDISKTRITDISPLRQIRHRLNGLSIHRLELVKMNEVEDLFSVIMDLNELRYLDASDRPKAMFHQISKVKYFSSPNILTHIVHLDLSGNPFGLRYEDIENFFKNHPCLQFCGLASWQANSDHELENISKLSEFYPHITILGDRGNSLLLNTLSYCKDRTIYLNHAFQQIFEATTNANAPKPELLSAVLLIMRLHIRKSDLMLAGTAVVYNLTRSELSTKIPSDLLNKAVRLTLLAMEKFPENHQLHKNCFLTLCSDTVLHEAKFNCKQCCELVFNGLIRFDDVHMKRMGVAIISILAAEIKTSELEDLARDPIRVRCLLSYVAEKCLLLHDLKDIDGKTIEPRYLSKVPIRSEGPPIFDTTLRFTLSALWNLTDECYDACIGFVNEGGLRIYEKVLKRFSNQDEEIKNHVFTKCLGLLNNVAELERTGLYLMNVKLISFFLEMLKHTNIQISYFAAGIMAHLSCIPDDLWLDKLGSVYTKDQCSKLLGRVVCNWVSPESEMVAYRSFAPFEALVIHEESRLEIQLWAVWAINHILSKKVDRYRQSLRECEKLCTFLQKIRDSSPISLCLQNNNSSKTPPYTKINNFNFYYKSGSEEENFYRSVSQPVDQYSFIRNPSAMNFSQAAMTDSNFESSRNESILTSFTPTIFENVTTSSSESKFPLAPQYNKQGLLEEDISSVATGALPSSAGPDDDLMKCAKLIKSLSSQILNCIES